MVSTTGSDSAAGTAAAPFRTIQKCASVATAGDICEIQGGVYRETITPAQSGTSTAPITFRAAAGQQVIVSGADPVAGWTLTSGNIYTAPITLNDDTRQQLFINDAMFNRARWPNAGSDLLHAPLAFADGGTTTSTLVDAALPTIAGGWTGANLHVWAGSAWMSATGTVTSTSAGSVGYSGANSECGGGLSFLCVSSGTRYYLDGVRGALDSAGEWFYDKVAHSVSLWAPGGGIPTGVTMKQRQWAFDLSGRSFIQVSGLGLQAASVLTTDTSSDNVLDSLDIHYVSHFDTIPIPNVSDDSVAAAHLLTSGIILNGTRNQLRNSTITGSAGNGVSIQGTANRVDNNLISEINYMGTWSAGVYIRGQNEVVTRNTIFDTGRDGITANYLGDGIYGSAHTDFTGNEISYNEIFSWGVMNEDSGGIYSCCGTDMSGGSIKYNYVHDNNARGRVGSAGSGIMLDNGSKNMSVHHNVVANALTAGIGINGNYSGDPSNAKIRNNTLMGGQYQSLGMYVGFSSVGAEIVNNILEKPNNVSGGTQSNNSTPGSAPGYLAGGPYLASASPMIDAGAPVTGITDGYVGASPDIGAYEYGTSGWRAGCSLPGCTFPTDARHTIDNLSSNISYSAGWAQCTSGCNSQFGTTLYGDSVSYSNVAGATATVSFTGTRAQLYGQTASGAGIGTVSIDGGPAVQVDWFSGSSFLPPAIGNLLLYTTPTLSPGAHTMTVTALGTTLYGSSAYINIDRVAVDPGSTVSTSVGNATQGSGPSQVTYTGGGWMQCYSGCNGGFGSPTVVFDNDDVASTGTAGDTATIRFYGKGIVLYGATGTGGGVGSVFIDGSAGSTVSWYRNTVLTGNQLVFDSGDLGWGFHTLILRATGTNGAGGYPYINLDRFILKQ
ncbi:right-handed parallel beta-helix repeat-containing protein [Microbacterium sp. Au-Mic1]|uniref:right-handed parallel beta-helix repeat-containing protein n=1 Tax=Microbacterium sp. Au-Mic1 TaxID=2906457 RepID=UPI001E320696|nr:right-handed parallel beta-helix repeat-containing protein [Microbacterium sp. Au-Mic1]MCE4026253.1 right-handed parallel beta-helix repeat-containing protein [Microbacterium sp. Au-Mic1]